MLFNIVYATDSLTRIFLEHLQLQLFKRLWVIKIRPLKTWENFRGNVCRETIFNEVVSMQLNM